MIIIETYERKQGLTVGGHLTGRARCARIKWCLVRFSIEGEEQT